MADMLEQRKQVLARQLDQMREQDDWHPFQNFVLGLLVYDGYTDVRLSNVRSDFDLDGDVDQCDLWDLLCVCGATYNRKRLIQPRFERRA